MNINHVVFSGNSAGSVSDTQGFQLGGAIFNVDGVANITASTFVDNQAIGFNAQGGAIQTSNGSTLNITGSKFVNNQAVGSENGSGGAIFGDPAVININSSTFTDNLAEGDGSTTISGGAIVMTALTSSTNPSPSLRPSPTVFSVETRLSACLAVGRVFRGAPFRASRVRLF